MCSNYIGPVDDIIISSENKARLETFSAVFEPTLTSSPVKRPRLSSPSTCSTSSGASACALSFNSSLGSGHSHYVDTFTPLSFKDKDETFLSNNFRDVSHDSIDTTGHVHEDETFPTGHLEEVSSNSGDSTSHFTQEETFQTDHLGYSSDEEHLEKSTKENETPTIRETSLEIWLNCNEMTSDGQSKHFSVNEESEDEDEPIIFWEGSSNLSAEELPNNNSLLRSVSINQSAHIITSNTSKSQDEGNPVIFWETTSSDLTDYELSSVPSINNSHISDGVPSIPSVRSMHCRSQVEFTFIQAADLLKASCCEKGCLQKITIAEVMECRKTNSKKPWVLEQLRVFRNGDGHYCNFVAHGKPVCAVAWKSLYAVSDSMFSDACRLQDNGVVEVIHKNKSISRNCLKSINTRVWLEAFIKVFGESMPHIKLTLLPSALTKQMVFLKMLQDHIEQKTDHTIVQWRQFYNIWNVYFSNVKIRKETCFTKCTPCTVAADQRGKTLDKDKRKAIELVLNQHLETAKKERAAYEKHKNKARNNNRYMCISIDGMDQSKTTVPHLTRVDKGSQHLWRMRTHVTGALVHGTMDYGKDAIMFINTADIPSDSNLTLQVLLTSLEMHIRRYNKLPEKLYLQFDNCWRENKNKYILCFAYLLVAMGIVKKVRINFLIVGHTHNDVDQAFSRLAEALRKWAAHTMESLKDVIKKSYEKPCPEVVTLDHVYDFKSWLEPHIYGPFKGHSKPHSFRIMKRDGKTIMQYRQYTGDKWEPSEGLQCLKTLPDLTDVPDWISPIMERLCLNMIRLHIPKFFHRLEKHEQTWWTRYLEDLEKVKQIPAKTTHWPLMTVAAVAGTQTSDTREVDNSLPDSMQPIWRKLNAPMPAITVGSQGRTTGPTIRRDNAIQERSGIQSNEGILDSRTMETEGIIDNGTEIETSLQDTENELTQYGAIKEGDFVGLYVQHHFSGGPQIGKVLEVDIEEECVLIQWYSASWTGKCAPLWHGGGAHRKPRSELIDIRCIVLWQFKLTNASFLSSSTVAKLKKVYQEIQS